MAEKLKEIGSPFRKREPIRIGFGTMMLLLLMVVGAGLGLLIYYALRVPAITSEINAWLGRPDAPFDQVDARRAQVTFALFVYTAPLALGMLVYLLHFIINWVDRLVRRRSQVDDREFQMEDVS